MRKLRRIATLFGTAAMMAAAPAIAQGADRRPNIVLIVADDLGFTDLGSFGGEIRTPNLDRLARKGVRFSNFHVAPACSPTRSMLLTGVDHHRAGFGTFAELIQSNQRGKPGYEGRIAERAVSVARRLRDTGYATFLSGKWHLGEDAESDPSRQGFARSFALIPGGASHFGQRKDGAPGPDGEYREDGRRLLKLPDNFYSSDAYTDRMIDFIREAKAAPAPFFAYLAYTAPHYPLQAPPADIARYAKRYTAGFAALRRQRLAGLQREGLLPSGAYTGAEPDLDSQWAAMSPDARAMAARKMAVYAAMVDRLDSNVGRLVKAIRKTGRFDNTIFIFLSDNGPEGTELERSEHYSAMGQAILDGWDNSLGSIGSARSYAWYGPGWARASSAPFRGYKHFSTEGGIRVPMFISAPGRIRASRAADYAFVTDLPVTLLDWAEARLPTEEEGLPYEGHSLRPLVDQSSRFVSAATVEAGWELWGRRAFRMGRWKAVLIPPSVGSGGWELYDMETDPSEKRDLAATHPDTLARLVQGWDAYVKRVGVVLPTEPGL